MPEDPDGDYPDEEWIRYDSFAEQEAERVMLGQALPEGGPGPPAFPLPPPPPPPPLPGHSHECASFSSQFDGCDISKVRFLSSSLITWLLAP
jgi:hypothetical protein